MDQDHKFEILKNQEQIDYFLSQRLFPTGPVLWHSTKRPKRTYVPTPYELPNKDPMGKLKHLVSVISTQMTCMAKGHS